ncbi:P-loop NTPase fold protein [Commensalibacter oyaizuii]|uniref:KAP NTPase domain-containing protein n=1 Tax=Commensalibacter oyaizuii TaxID=3043873 RepID=A0ABT6PZ78_9PROT|nr:P-loop NTPase fold protein [Commensalibacter sp. TBRC 16381]MDI2089816.1 hypothetical protein [Commensalibacter sp. TBRC 16381]
MLTDSIVNVKDPNQHITEYLNSFIYASDCPNYAVLVTGKCGYDKSHYIDHFINNFCTEKTILQTPIMKNCTRLASLQAMASISHIVPAQEYMGQVVKDSQKRFIKINLSGLKCIAELKDAIFSQQFPAFNSKISKTVSSFFRKISDRVKNYLSLFQIPFSALQKKDPFYLASHVETIFIFDNIDKANIPLKDLIEYINNFITKEKKKVILVADEQELLKKENAKFHDFFRDDSSYDAIIYTIFKENRIKKTLEVQSYS